MFLWEQLLLQADSKYSILRQNNWYLSCIHKIKWLDFRLAALPSTDFHTWSNHSVSTLRETKPVEIHLMFFLAPALIKVI